jgi:hypothetical protein
MASCPNKNSTEWKKLLKQVNNNEDLALRTWFAYGETFPEMYTNTELRKMTGVPYKGFPEQITKSSVSIRRYNARNGTAHSFIPTQIGESQQYRLEFVPNYLPVNLEKQRQKDLARSERDKHFLNLYQLEFEDVSKEDIGKLAQDVVDTTIKPGVTELFESNPVLAKIGTIEQYSQYLDTIFPDSMVKAILYHGSYSKFESFDQTRLGETTGLSTYKDKATGEEFTSDSASAFFFSDDRLVSLSYGFKGRENYLNKVEASLNSIVAPSISSMDPKKGVAFLKTIPHFNNLIERIKLQNQGLNKEEVGKKIVEALKKEKQDFVKKSRDKGINAQGLSNQFNNYSSSNEEVKSFMQPEILERFQKNDKTIPNQFGTFETHSFHGYTGNWYIFNQDGRFEFVHGNDRFFADEVSTDRIKKFFEDSKKDADVQFEKSVEKAKSMGYKESVMSVMLNVKDPLSHDYEGSAFPDTYEKNEKYPTAYIAARQVAKAKKEGNDAVIYENVRDPFLSNSYGIFNTDNIHVLGSEKDVKSFEEFVGASKVYGMSESLPELQVNVLGNNQYEYAGEIYPTYEDALNAADPDPFGLSMVGMSSLVELDQHDVDLQMDLQNMDPTSRLLDYLYDQSTGRKSVEEFYKIASSLMVQMKSNDFSNSEIIEAIKCI